MKNVLATLALLAGTISCSPVVFPRNPTFHTEVKVGDGSCGYGSLVPPDVLRGINDYCNNGSCDQDGFDVPITLANSNLAYGASLHVKPEGVFPDDATRDALVQAIAKTLSLNWQKTTQFWSHYSGGKEPIFLGGCAVDLHTQTDFVSITIFDTANNNDVHAFMSVTITEYDPVSFNLGWCKASSIIGAIGGALNPIFGAVFGAIGAACA